MPGLLLGLELAHVQLYLEEVTTHLISPDQQRLQRSICALPPLACSLPMPGLGFEEVVVLQLGLKLAVQLPPPSLGPEEVVILELGLGQQRAICALPPLACSLPPPDLGLEEVVALQLGLELTVQLFSPCQRLLAQTPLPA